MSLSAPLRVLVDLTVQREAMFAQPAVQKHTLMWAGTQQEFQVIGYERKPMPPADQWWRCQQIECLPTVGRLAREKHIKLYTTPELEHESWSGRQAWGLHRFKGAYAFQKCEFGELEPAVNRSYFGGLSIEQCVSREAMIHYCDWLMKLDAERAVEVFERAPGLNLTEFHINNLRKLRFFKLICKRLNPQQYPDAFHLWTADVNGLDHFLTMDKRFINIISNRPKLHLQCWPISPAELVAKFSITDLDPIPLEFGTFYSYVFEQRS